MGKFVFPLLLLMFSICIGLLIYFGHVSVEDQPEMIVGIVILIICGMGYLFTSYRDEQRK